MEKRQLTVQKKSKQTLGYVPVCLEGCCNERRWHTAGVIISSMFTRKKGRQLKEVSSRPAIGNQPRAGRWLLGGSPLALSRQPGKQLRQPTAEGSSDYCWPACQLTEALADKSWSGDDVRGNRGRKCVSQFLPVVLGNVPGKHHVPKEKSKSS